MKLTSTANRRSGAAYLVEMPSRVARLHSAEGTLSAVLEDGRTIDLTALLGEPTQ